MIETKFLIAFILLAFILGWLARTLSIIHRVGKKYGNIEVGGGTIDFLIENLDKNKLNSQSNERDKGENETENKG